MNTLTLTTNDIEKKEYGILKVMRRQSFDLENKINNYWKKSNSTKIFNCVKEFLLLQQVGYDSIASKNDETLPIITGLAAKIALQSIEVDEPLDLFHTKKINYASSLPYPTNDCLEAYIQVMEESKSSTSLEQITSSLFHWVLNNTFDYLKEKNLIPELENYELTFNGEKYNLNITDLDKENKEKKSSFSLSRYNNQETKTTSTKNKITSPPQQAQIYTEEKSLPSETFIHGHDNVKTEFKKITTILKHRDYFQKLLPAKELFHNYLLVGPPGTGKTTLINTLAQQCDLEFRSIPCADLCSKYFGESAANIQEIYAQAKHLIEKDNVSGVILFFDEFDQIAGVRGNSPNDRERNSLVTTLNTNLDGTNSTAGILTFAATNVEQIIDPALLTRFQKLYVGYPETDEALIGMHQTIIQKIEHYAKQHNPNQKLFGDIDYVQILSFSQTDERYKSGRIINRILQNTTLEKVLTSYPSSPSLITTSDLVQEYKKYDLELGKKYTLQNEPGKNSITI